MSKRYIETKGRTFFAHNVLVDNTRVTDGAFSGTLEDLRHLQEIALARGDEPQLEQIFADLRSTCGAIYAHRLWDRAK